MYALNKKLLNKSMPAQLLDARLAHIFNKQQDVLATSSFGTTSAVLLHAINRVKPGHPVYFVDTKYHFRETLEYKDRLTRLLSLNVIDITPDSARHASTQKNKTWQTNPDLCCHINKVEPLRPIKEKHTVWLSGLMGFQNRHRSNLEFIEERDGLYKYYPVIDWTLSLVNDYFEQYGLPRHPLEEQGYHSIGCTHCTRKGDCRSGRWQNLEKTECGLHY